MAFTCRSAYSCSTCGQTAGIFICRGCSETFCLPHTNEHRQVLEKQMNEIIIDHNQLKDNLTGQAANEFHQTLFEQIDHWQEQSITRIRQLADDLRQQVTKTVQQQTDQLKEQLKQLTQDLYKAKQNGEFFENDLKQWSEQVKLLKQTYLDQQRIQLVHEKNSTPFISRITLTQQESNAYHSLAIDHLRSDFKYHNDQNNHLHEDSFVEELHNYSEGEHELQFTLEQYQAGSSLRFGIVSTKHTDNPERNFYGWAENHLVFLSGASKENYDGYFSDYRTNDVVILTLDCERSMISLTNERTDRTFDLDIDRHKCPLPWQPYIRFYLNSD